MSGVGRLRRDMAGRECRGRGGAVGDLISFSGGAGAPRQHVRTYVSIPRLAGVSWLNQLQHTEFT